MGHFLNRFRDKPARTQLLWWIGMIVLTFNSYFAARRVLPLRAFGAMIVAYALLMIMLFVAFYASGAMQNERKK